MCSPRHIGHSWWLAVCPSAYRSGRQSGSLRWRYLPYRVNIHLHARTGGETRFIDIRDSASSRHLDNNIKQRGTLFFIKSIIHIMQYTIYDTPVWSRWTNL